jgi:hypothetical protein
MEYKVAELEGELLDAAVAKANEDPTGDVNPGTPRVPLAYSTDWEYGGPIIERERIELHTGSADHPYWEAICGAQDVQAGGPTPLIAAMRAYVASKFGETVELP